MLMPLGLEKQYCYHLEDNMPPYSLIPRAQSKTMGRHFGHRMRIFSAFDDSAETKLDAMYKKYHPQLTEGSTYYGEGAIVFNTNKTLQCG